MKVRAIIFDVYQTLLEVGPPPLDAEARWRTLRGRLPEAMVAPTLAEFTERCGQVIRREHALARSRGIQWPEVCWPAVVGEVAPAVGGLEAAQREDWIAAHMQLGRTLKLAAGAGDVLRALEPTGLLLGIASNAQAYTWRELDDALAAAGSGGFGFAPDLCFWSFQHGFSKPDPHVFQILSARLCSKGVVPAEVLMVGDRLDNDILPARRAGWQGWRLRLGEGGVADRERRDAELRPRLDAEDATLDLAGDWAALGRFLLGPVAAVR